MGKPTREHKPKHDPTPSHDAAPDHVIRVDPPDLVKTVFLGGKQRLRYSVDNLRAGSRVTWHHVASGAGGSHNTEHAGRSSEVNEFASHAGDKEVDTSAEIDGRRETAASTTLRTPRSATNIIGMWGESKERGRTPVAHTMQSNEDLVLHVELPKVDASVDEANAGFTGGLKVRDWRKLGAKKFEVVLTPRPEAIPENQKEPADRKAPQDAKGSLVFVPRRVSISSIDPAPISMHIEVAATSQDAFGSRPGTTANAIVNVMNAWRNVYDKRIRAVERLIGQLAKTDPLPVPLMERIAKGVFVLALNAATAGIGAGVASKLFGSLNAGNGDVAQGAQEFAKVLIEGSAAAILEERISRATVSSAEPSAGRNPSGMLLSPDLYFATCQQAALDEARDDHLNRVNTTLTSLTTRLDRDNPGAGYRVAVEAHDKIKTVALGESPLEQQFAQSLQAWCTFSAQARLGTGDSTHGRDRGTELGTQVDAMKTLNPDPAADRDLHKTPGVLRIELAEDKPGHLMAVRSFIAGFTSETAVKNLHRKVKDLHIPIVARFKEPSEHISLRGFVISRNENGAVLADAKGELMQEMFGGKDDHAAARLIFEQLAHQTVAPERG